MRTDSPEDRLLKLIKGKGKKREDQEAKEASAAPSLLADSFNKAILASKLLKPAFLASVNKALLAILIMMAAYLIWSFSFVKVKDIGPSLSGVQAPVAAFTEAPRDKAGLPKSKDYAFYSKDIGGKKIFGGSGAIESGAGAPSVEAAKRFNLVGIITGENPQAIIEDKEVQKTYYLNEGQSVSGITIQKIGDGRVVLSYEGKDAELVM